MQVVPNGDSVCAEESDFLDGVCKVLKSVGSNLQALLSDFSNPPSFIHLDSDIARLQRETCNLRENIKYLIGSQLHGARQAMACLNSELEELRIKYHNLQTEWDSQQEHLGRMQGDMYKMRNQLQHQSQFCASLGAVMGNLIWKASRIPQVVDMLLSGNKVGEFLNIVNGTLMSFMETYDNHMPGQCADESQFIMAMCGIVTNIAASPAGRQFLVTSPNGKELLENFVRILPAVPCPTGNCLKRLLLMALYNISINQYGLAFLQEQEDILPAVTQSLQCDTTTELKLMSLRLLQSITYEIPMQALLIDLIKFIPLDTIEKMTTSTDTETKNVAQEILDNIERGRQKYGMGSGGRCQKTVPYNRCYFVQTGDRVQNSKTTVKKNC